MAAQVAEGPKFQAGLPKNKDGRFLIPVQLDQSANVSMTVVVNWMRDKKK
jgi:hypothetical protein